MTIRDMLDQEIELGGDVFVRKWDSDAEDYSLNLALTNMPADHPALDEPIGHIYTNVQPIQQNFSSHPCYVAQLIIELREEC